MEQNQSLKNRISQICDAVDAWFMNEDGLFASSVEQTVNEGLFPRHDVMHMADEVKKTVTKESLTHWTEKVKMPARESGSQKNLCLHAGNLPMVGLQDVIAAVLSGGIYYGKLSRKDPWLLDGLLHLLKKRLPGHLGKWSIGMEDLAGIRADRVLFAGSEGSVDAVTRRCREEGLAGEHAVFLYRTARFSMVWFTHADFSDEGTLKPEVCSQLTEAILRYEGRGCRSAAVVVAPFGLTSSLEALKAAKDHYIAQNPFSRESGPGIRYWESYLKCMERPVLPAGPVRITDDPEMAGKQDIVCWVTDEKPEQKTAQLASQFGRQLQQVYVTGKCDPGSALRMAPLSRAQRPPVDWQPDGVDVLHWLCTDQP